MKVKRTLKRLALILFAFLVVAGLGFYGYTRDYYHAASQDYVITEETEDYLVYGDRGSVCGLVFYPGAKVEASAYSPILSKLADNGVCCVVVKMPFHLAVLRPDAAGQVIREIPEVEHWYIGGHSLGGAMAADYAASRDDFQGVILLAAYPTKPIVLPVLSIYGSEDNVLNHEKYQSALPNADALTEYIIEGGNHAYFGDYGEQKGDGTAGIIQETQWQETVDVILEFIQEAEDQ